MISLLPILNFLGLCDKQIGLPLWLQDPKLTKASLIFMGLWGAGSGMIIWLAGLQDIPKHLYESAEIDGASK
ncbi:MAG: ABC transporter permease, partial [Candidatus Omnitrophica bacterium]|nr:ABC transporter permease [Candidatus Omnitrophota bacterium]